MSSSFLLLIAGSASVAVIHSILPDHWVPLALVARSDRWPLARVARISGLAAAGHVLASLLLAGVVAAIGLRFQAQIDAQQGRIVGGILVLSGIAFLVWGLTGHGHSHDGDHGHGHHEDEFHDHDHDHDSDLEDQSDSHDHEHRHGDDSHAHPHSHEAFIQERQEALTRHVRQRTLAGLLATIAVPFGVAASPDLTILPIGLAASARGPGPVALVLGVFAAVTIAVFVGLTVLASALGYQFRGKWLEDNANTVTSLVLIAIGVIAYLGL